MVLLMGKLGHLQLQITSWLQPLPTMAHHNREQLKAFNL